MPASDIITFWLKQGIRNADDWWLPETGLMFPIKISLPDATIARHSIFNIDDKERIWYIVLKIFYILTRLLIMLSLIYH